MAAKRARGRLAGAQANPQQRPVYVAIVGALAAAGALVAAPAAEAVITGMSIDCSRSQSPTYCALPNNVPTFGGASFGAVGQYEKIRGTATGTLNRLDPRNDIIMDIDLAPAVGDLVAYSMDFIIIKPVTLSTGNHRMFYDFNNRGEMRFNRFNDTALTNNPTTAADAGTGYLMNLGYTIVSNGWDFGASTTDDMKITVPVATDGLSTITGRSYEYIVFDNATTMTSPLAFPAADATTKTGATLTRRAFLNDPPTVVPATGWDYTSTVGPTAGTAIKLTPAGPFTMSYIYEFTYVAKNPVVSGIGLAATRDFISFLRHATVGNPLAGDVQKTFSYSISQPSRTLNDFVALGFNQDEGGQRVLDGILSHTGGGSGDQINYRFGQTGRTERNRQNHLYPEGVFPFAHQTLTDDLSGQTGGRDIRCTATNTCPKRFEVNTSNEYWVKAGSLLHSDTKGKDLKDPDDVRFYLLSGLPHGVGSTTSKGVCQQYGNAVSPYPVHRALLVALDDWVTSGKKPPKSEVPEGGNRVFAVPVAGSQVGIVPQKDLGWPEIPGVTYTGVITTRYFLDFGPDLDIGLIGNAPGSYPPAVAGRPAYPIFVSKVDKDGNEKAGVRLPEVQAPIATTTGWGLRDGYHGGNDGCEAAGQNIPFKTTKAERLAAGDPRDSLEERYKNHDGYVKEVKKAAEDLGKKGFLLPADVQAYINAAQASSVLP